MSTKSDLLLRLAAAARDHKLVPFVGAGCSLGHVRVDWDEITAAMAQEMPGCVASSNWDVAEAYAQMFGNRVFANLLRRYLLIDSLDDSRGTTPLQILALELRSVYSTNQDNVLERAAEKCGRPRVVVSTLDDLATVRPGDRILFKYHGALDHPDTLVFTAAQYRNRMANPDHFMDIRLRSDLLTKKFLFIGYSFRDPNIKELFKEMKVKFSAALPGSFLLAYNWSADLDGLCRAHGVTCVDPASHIGTPAIDPSRNLEAFLRELCTETFRLTTAAQLEDFTNPILPPAIRVAIREQVEPMLETALSSNSATGIATFRGVCDGVEIPESLQPLVANAIVEIIRKATPDQLGDLTGALFNLRLAPASMLEPVSAFLAFVNRVQSNGALFLHSPPGNSWPRQLLPVAAARAIQLLDEWKEPITDNFYASASHWFDDNWAAIPDEFKATVRQVVASAWARRHTIYEQPIDRAERLARLAHRPNFSTKPFAEIRSDLFAMLPKQFLSPREG
jgi:hypothetical protein